MMMMKSNAYDLSSSLSDYTHAHSEVIEYLLILLTRLTEVSGFLILLLHVIIYLSQIENMFICE